MQIRAYPNRDYSCHGGLQAKISQHAAFKFRMIYRGLLICGASFFGMLVAGYFGSETTTWGFIITFEIILILSFLLGIYTPRPKCPLCNSRMKHQYCSKPRGPDEDLYIVCHPCKIYADAHCARE